MNFSKSVLLLFILLTVKSKAATCTAVASTNWSLTSTWSCGSTPTCNDIIVIPSGYTVTINKTIDLTGGGCTGTKIDIYGVLFFSGNTSRLDVVASSTINIFSGGKITTDQPGNNSQKINIGNGPSEWTSNDGNLSGPWTITNGSSGSNPALPIQLINFSGYCNSKEIILNWATATEKDNEYFLLEKSTNATDWQFLAKINGSGTSSTTKKYDYRDKITSNDLTYYRLSQVDRIGTSEVFKAIDINCQYEGHNQIVLYPNPATSELNIMLNTSSETKNNSIKIMNLLGEVVLETKIDLYKGSNSFLLPIELQSGTYFVSFYSDGMNLPSQKINIIR